MRNFRELHDAIVTDPERAARRQAEYESAVAVDDAIATPTGVASSSGTADSTTAEPHPAGAHVHDRVSPLAGGTAPGEKAVSTRTG